MGPFEDWIQKKSGEQQLSYQPEYWDQFQSFARKQRRRRRWMIALFLLLGLSMAGLGGYWALQEDGKTAKPTTTTTQNPNFQPYTSSPGSSTPPQAEAQSSEITAADPNPQNEKEAISAPNREHPDGPSSASSTTPRAPQSNVDEIIAEIPVASPGVKNNYRETMAELAPQAGVKEQGSLSPQNNALSRLPLAPLRLLPRDPSPDRPSGITSSERHPIKPTLVGCLPGRKGLWLTVDGMFVNSQFSAPHLFSGGTIALEYKSLLHPNWSFTTGLGLTAVLGDFGIQQDHSIVRYDFQKSVSGYRSLPRIAYALKATVGLEYHFRDWHFQGGIALQRLLAVRGAIETYGFSDGTPDIQEGSAWLPTDGFTIWSPGLEFGIHRQFGRKWQLGLQGQWQANGWLEKGHKAYYDHRSASYIRHPESNWANGQGNIQLSISLKYQL